MYQKYILVTQITLNEVGSGEGKGKRRERGKRERKGIKEKGAWQRREVFLTT